jgi:hypothetical protein
VSIHLFELFELQFRKLFLVIGGKKVHVLVSICSPLFFSSFCDAFDLLFLLSLAVFSPLEFLISNKGRGSIRDDEVFRGDRFLRRVNLEELRLFIDCALRGDFWNFFLWVFLCTTLENDVDLGLKRMSATGFWFWQAILIKLALIYVYLRII